MHDDDATRNNNRQDAQVFYPPDTQRDEQAEAMKHKVEANRESEAKLVAEARGLKAREQEALKHAKEAEGAGGGLKPLQDALTRWSKAERSLDAQRKKLAEADLIIAELEATMEERRRAAEQDIRTKQAAFKKQFTTHVAQLFGVRAVRAALGAVAAARGVGAVLCVLRPVVSARPWWWWWCAGGGQWLRGRVALRIIW